MTRELLFSVTKDDFELQTFRAGGKGGQAQNKKSTGVRLVHKASGARGEARDQRSFDQNRKNAFLRLIETDTFKKWHKLETARRLYQYETIEEMVVRSLAPHHLKIEIRNEAGQWVEVSLEYPIYPWSEENGE